MFSLARVTYFREDASMEDGHLMTREICSAVEAINVLSD